MSAYLVTGGAGFIGSNCVRALLNVGHRVRVVDNFSTGKIENLIDVLPSIDLLTGDLADITIARQAVRGMEYILHLAAVPSVQYSVEQPLASADSMIHTSLNLFSCASEEGVKRIVQSASAAAYGDEPTLPKAESMLPCPKSPYAASKLAQENFAAAFCAIHGMQITSLRFFNVYGPRQDPSSPYSGVISIFMNRLLHGQTPIVYGDGENTRDFVYVQDVVDALLAACICPWTGKSEVINIGTGKEISLNQLLDELNSILGTHIQTEYQPPRAGDILRSVADIRKAQELLGYHPQYTIGQGLTELVAFEKGIRK